MKVSVVTICRNSSSTIADCIASVREQDYPEIEHIIVDGDSEDDTVPVVLSMENRVTRLISEPDEGIYNAMNKGIRMATGDIVGILNSDDMYQSPAVVSRLVSSFREHSEDIVYGDVNYVKRDDLSKRVRYFSSHRFRPWKLRFGFMPPHAAIYLKRELFDTYGYYKTDYRIAADFELMVRLLVEHEVEARYLPVNMVRMREGGVSNASLKNRLLLTREVIRACRENGVYTNWAMQLLKYPVKVLEMFRTDEPVRPGRGE